VPVKTIKCVTSQVSNDLKGSCFGSDIKRVLIDTISHFLSHHESFSSYNTGLYPSVASLISIKDNNHQIVHFHAYSN